MKYLSNMSIYNSFLSYKAWFPNNRKRACGLPFDLFPYSRKGSYGTGNDLHRESLTHLIGQ